MKKLLFALSLALTALIASAAIGDTFTVGNLNYVVKFDSNNLRYAEVHVTGLSAAGKSKTDLALSIPGFVAYGGVNYAVTEVAANAFAGQTNIYQLNVQFGVNAINSNAFKNCSRILIATFGSSMRFIYSDAFTGCTSLDEVCIANPDPSSGVFSSSAFPAGISALYVPKTNGKSVEAYRSLTAFSKFKTIKKSSSAHDFIFNDGGIYNVTKASTKVEQGELALVGYITRASAPAGEFTPDYGGYYAGSPSGYYFTTVADSACADETVLKSIDFSNVKQLTKIGYGAFRGCTNLASVNIKCATLQEISNYAFSQIPIKGIFIPAGVTSCATYFVDGSSQLQEISVDAANPNYSSANGILYNKAKTQLIRCPEGFGSDMRPQNFPNSLKIIGPYAFDSCKKLTSIQLPFGVNTVSNYAFRYCTGLVAMSVPSSVSSWGNYVLTGSTSLTTLLFNVKTPPTLNDNDFNNLPKQALYVPYESKSAYQAAAAWKTWPTIKHGSYDLAEPYFACDDTDRNTWYTIHSTKPETINGVAYAGRAKLVAVERNTQPGTIKVPEYVTDPAGKKYAVTSINPEVCLGGLGESTELKVGVNVDTISDRAFYSHTNLKTLQLNSNVKYIGQHAFYDCRIQNSISLPYGIKYLGNYAFYNNSFKFFLIPSSLNTLGYYALSKNNYLTDLVINDSYWSKSESWDLTNIPTSCRLYVPTGCVHQYKNNAKWGKLNVMPGAYDFTFNDLAMDRSHFHMSVTDNSPITVDGVSYAGKAKYVYHPSLSTFAMSTFICANVETDNTNGGNKKYLMTEIADSCFAGTSNLASITVNNMKHLERIGDYAFYCSGIQQFTTPATLKYLGKYAFVNCKQLSELLITEPTSKYTRGGQLFGLNANDFRCFVKWTSYSEYKNEVKGYGTGASEVNMPVDRLNSYLQVDDDNKMTSFCVDHPVNWRSVELCAYAVTSYDPTTKIAYTNMQDATPAGTGLIVTFCNRGQIYKLERPKTTPSEPNNLLKGVVSGTDNPYTRSVGFALNTSDKYFWRPTSSYPISAGHAYLLLTSNQAGSTTKITIDRWQQGLKGDVNGDGVVNVSDVTALINKILGTASYSDSVCDIDGNGTVNVSDVTALINLILG